MSKAEDEEFSQFRRYPRSGGLRKKASREHCWSTIDEILEMMQLDDNEHQEEALGDS